MTAPALALDSRRSTAHSLVAIDNCSSLVHLHSSGELPQRRRGEHPPMCPSTPPSLLASRRSCLLSRRRSPFLLRARQQWNQRRRRQRMEATRMNGMGVSVNLSLRGSASLSVSPFRDSDDIGSGGTYPRRWQASPSLPSSQIPSDLSQIALSLSFVSFCVCVFVLVVLCV
ncbi:uncharacterized protein DS421_11g341140 [Arachis hypogaea]|nr:uncharacterized protein DS421_11g341140 [Arachis hypogaea]